jgi:hypothetical protein
VLSISGEAPLREISLIYLRTLICEKCEPPGKEGDYTYSLRVFIGVRFLPLLRSR